LKSTASFAIDEDAVKPMLLAFALPLLLPTLARAQEPAAQEDALGWQRLVGILQYLESDYPAAAQSKSESELAEHRALIDEAIATAKQLGSRANAFLGRLDAIRARIEAVQDPDGVSRDCAALIEDLVATAGLSRSPRLPPEMEKGKLLYSVGCAACHAQDGSGKVEIADQLQPKPSSFLEPEPLDSSAPYKVFNILTFGINGTSMPAFDVLNEDERWALAFYIFTLRQPPCDHKPARASLETVATSNDSKLASTFGAKEVACLRQRPPSIDEEQSLLIARAGIENAIRLSEQGKAAEARRSIVDAYLRGIEPVEPMLKARNPRLVRELERTFIRARLSADTNKPQMAAEARRLLTLIDEARRRHSAATDFWSVFWLALLVIVREGFEASVVIAALLAVLKKMQQREQERIVHAGWISAIALGAVAFAFGHRLLAGADRELLEAIVALVAVAMLVYAALWLNARSTMRRFMGGLRARMQGALGSGSALGLFTVAFTAMLRESFETAIFLQGLSIDSPTGVAWGAAGGAALLVALVIFVNQVGYRLPMKALFNGSTVLLLVTAVVLLGKGLHALQTLGILLLRPIPLFELEPFGIYPDLYSFGPQLILAAAPLLWFAWRRRSVTVSHEAVEPESGRC
jgi:high-affinity iron transporter